tara:strand:- start:10102 stop:10362 length:261 start_codon:yes stop_codon:yes gene_type:complete
MDKSLLDDDLDEIFNEWKILEEENIRRYNLRNRAIKMIKTLNIGDIRDIDIERNYPNIQMKYNYCKIYSIISIGLIITLSQMYYYL